MNNEPKGLIYESYQIEDITEEECRAIFFGWTLTLNECFDPVDEIKKLLKTYGSSNPNHPMTKILKAGEKKEKILKVGRVGRKNKLKTLR